jgi:hypothetical protein
MTFASSLGIDNYKIIFIRRSDLQILDNPGKISSKLNRLIELLL